MGPRWRSLLGDAVACVLLGAVVRFAVADGAEAVGISVALAFPSGVLLWAARWADARQELNGARAAAKLAVTLGCTFIVGTVVSTFFPVAVGWDSLDDRWPEGLALGVAFVGLRLWEMRRRGGGPLPEHRRIA